MARCGDNQSGSVAYRELKHLIEGIRARGIHNHDRGRQLRCFLKRRKHRRANCIGAAAFQEVAIHCHYPAPLCLCSRVDGLPQASRAIDDYLYHRQPPCIPTNYNQPNNALRHMALASNPHGRKTWQTYNSHCPTPSMSATPC